MSGQPSTRPPKHVLFGTHSGRQSGGSYTVLGPDGEPIGRILQTHALDVRKERVTITTRTGQTSIVNLRSEKPRNTKEDVMLAFFRHLIAHRKAAMQRASSEANLRVVLEQKPLESGSKTVRAWIVLAGMNNPNSKG